MTRITNYAPPPAVAGLMSNLVTTRKAAGNRSASASFTLKGLEKTTTPMPVISQRDMRLVTDWMLRYGPAAWRGANQDATKRAILDSINQRRFDAEYWRAATLLTDRIEISYPEIQRPPDYILDPLDPYEIHNSKCTYLNRSTYWPFSQAQYEGWPPLPGWSCSTDANRWFIDDWHAQRSMTFRLPNTTQGIYPRPWLVHLQGSIEAKAEESGLKLWYAPVLGSQFADSQSYADSYAYAIGDYWTRLTDGGIILPGPVDGWRQVVAMDEVINMQKLSKFLWHGSNRYLNLKFSTRAPCGKYRAANGWAKCQIDVDVRVYYPAFLG